MTARAAASQADHRQSTSTVENGRFSIFLMLLTNQTIILKCDIVFKKKKKKTLANLFPALQSLGQFTQVFRIDEFCFAGREPVHKHSTRSALNLCRL